jgi:hypothetical protein
MSSTPIALSIALMSDPQGTFITLRNAGVGSALIEDARVYQGRETAAQG